MSAHYLCQSQITIKFIIDMSFPQKYYSPSFCNGGFYSKIT